MNAITNISILLFISFSMSIPTCWSKEKIYGDADVERVVRVYDGDTCTVDIRRFYVKGKDGKTEVLEDNHPIISESINIRTRGVDTPEIKSKDEKSKALAIKARNYVRERLRDAKKITLRNIVKDKYFRLVATVDVDGHDIAQDLIHEGLALPYDGGKKADWEEELADKEA